MGCVLIYQWSRETPATVGTLFRCWLIMYKVLCTGAAKPGERVARFHWLCSSAESGGFE